MKVQPKRKYFFQYRSNTDTIPLQDLIENTQVLIPQPGINNATIFYMASGASRKICGG
jgi:hypothetical protein